MENKYVIKITTGNMIQVVRVPRGCDMLYFLQECVGGYIEPVSTYITSLSFPVIMLVDEEGVIKDSKMNRHATRLSRVDAILGDAVFVKTETADMEGGEEDFGFFTRDESIEVIGAIARRLRKKAIMERGK